MNYVDRSIYIFILYSFVGLANLYPESGIYLPFPDLPREILEPKLHTSEERIVLPPPDTKEKTTKSRYESEKPRHSSVEKKRMTRSEKPSLPIPQENSLDTVPIPDKTAAGKKLSEALDTKESSVPSEEEWGNFRDAMVQIRSHEQTTPEKATEEYRELMGRFSHPLFRSKILISLAWNFYHREDYLSSLDACIRILEDRDLIESEEYPTAMYLAYLIHGKPWNGRNAGFQRKFSEIFHRNANAGRKNFQTSLYLSKIPNPG